MRRVLVLDSWRKREAGGCPIICPVDNYLVETSRDGKTWTEAARGESANIQNNPIERRIFFRAPVLARQLRFTALHVIAASHVVVVELNVIEDTGNGK